MIIRDVNHLRLAISRLYPVTQVPVEQDLPVRANFCVHETKTMFTRQDCLLQNNLQMNRAVWREEC